MDQLFTKYERELVILRSLCREYAQRYPKVAAKLQMGGDTCDDPHVERLIQGVALLSARVAKRLDDSYPQFTEALLNLVFPHYLRPFPSCAIARVLSEPAVAGESRSVTEMLRGTLLESAPVHGVPCTFKTVYDVRPSAVVLAAASFETFVCAPVATRLPDGVTSSLTLKFESARSGEPLCQETATVLRVYADGDASFCAALRDALFMHTRAAYVQLDDDGPWERLPVVPIHPAGFTDDEALIPFDARSHKAYRVLAEYFAFPEKFNFFDIDLTSLLPRMPASQTHFTLRLAVADVEPDGDRARMLASLSKQHLVQGCTPVVNLFRQPGVPITYDQLRKGTEDLPVMHVFVVIPAPEKAQMIPRTYETLASLGQQNGMTGQVKMIDQTNENARLQETTSKQFFGDAVDRRANLPQALPEVVSTANKIDKPSELILKNMFGLRVCVAMLNACEFNQARRQWRYREIYIHSKLLLVDDVFFTLGSANLNQRSMAVDSEINLATNDVRHATGLRTRIWSQLTGGKYAGGNTTPQEIEDTFISWVALMNENKDKQKALSTDPKKKQMKGFIVPLDDGRSSTMRLG